LAVSKVFSEFVLSASGPEQFPREEYPEIAFLGRSNVGKSSLINALTGGKKLAFTSNKPGCTQAINFYRVDSSYCFVDLPGYGYARVSQDRTLEWKKLIESYLLERWVLQLCILVLDARRGWMEKDLDLRRWLEVHHRPYLVVATKVDKLNQSERQRSLARLNQDSDAPALPCSAITGRGVREIWQAMITKTRRAQ
jgi:GTP-binding protein